MTSASTDRGIARLSAGSPLTAVSKLSGGRVDALHPRGELFEVPLVLGSEDLGENAVDHDLAVNKLAAPVYFGFG